MQRSLHSLLLPLVLLLAATSPAFAAPVFREFHVAPGGDDGASGDAAHPFRTLTRARDAVRAVNRQMAGDIVVQLHGGTYRLTRPVDFGVQDSGADGFRVIYRAAPGEVPVLDGGVTVTGWTPDHGGIYRATLDRDEKLRSLFVNGTRADMASAEFDGLGGWGEFVVHGNEPWAETPGKTFDGVKFKAGGRTSFAHPEDIELAQNKTWTSVVVGVREIAMDGDLMVAKLQQPYGAIAASLAWHCYFDPNKRFTLRNAYELLTRPGQFYFNRTTHTLYYYPKPGEDMAKAEVIAPMSEGLLRITGESTEHRVERLTFEGLSFTYDHWLLKQVGDSRGFAGVQSLGLYTKFRADGNWHKDHYDLCDLPQATVELRSCRDVQFVRNHFTHLSSGTGISLINDVVDSTVVGNTFTDSLGNAINVGHPQHYIIGDGPLYPAGVEGVCARDTIGNNWIRHVSLDFHQEEAISGFFTQAVTITHNDVADVPYGGIALGWWWGNGEIPPSKVPKDNAITYNRVADTQQILVKDGGPIYVLGEQPGGIIEGNYVEGARRLMYCDDGSAYWNIRNNVFYVRPWTEPKVPEKPGKYPDHTWLFLWTPRIHDITVDSNFSNVPIVFNDATATKVTNQTVAYPFPAQAQQIIEAAGLEPAFRDIIPPPAVKPKPAAGTAGGPAASQTPVFENGALTDHVPWRDTEGNLINAHDGGIIYADGAYHWYGLALRPLPAVSGPDGGQKTTVGVVMYRSSDLNHWAYEGVVLASSSDPKNPLYGPMRFERPKIIYNDRTKQYVMWFHFVSYPGDHGNGPTQGEAGVATCDRVNGTYQFRGLTRPLGEDGIVRDSTQFKDDDGSAYFIYDRDVRQAGPKFGRVLHIVKLSDDYLSCTDTFYKIENAAKREAPVMIKRHGYYYLVTSGMTGWAFNESNYYRATRVLGPYEELGDPFLGEGRETTYNAQGTYAFPVQGRPDEWIMMLERHNTDRMTDSSYIWLPVTFTPDDRIEFHYLPEWKLGAR
jgi:hypothetical protein